MGIGHLPTNMIFFAATLALLALASAEPTKRSCEICMASHLPFQNLVHDREKEVAIELNVSNWCTLVKNTLASATCTRTIKFVLSSAFDYARHFYSAKGICQKLELCT